MGEEDFDSNRLDEIQGMTEFDSHVDGDSWENNGQVATMSGSTPPGSAAAIPLPAPPSSQKANWNNKNWKGDIGLNNIGNTCFMNSGLQCLLHTAPLVEYFVDSERFEASTLVCQFHSLMMHAWFGISNSIAPHGFKSVLGSKHLQFKDWRQHDCQEFLATSLDTLHEELKAKRKEAPSVTDSESDSEGPASKRLKLEDAAQQYWDKYMNENNTVIASTFQGLYKSSVTCSDCSFISETYEPFMYLSLPIPRIMEKQLNVTFISMKDRTPLKVELTISVSVNVDKLIEEVVNKANNCSRCEGAKYVAAEVANHRVLCVLDDKTMIRSISTNSKNIYVYELNDNFDDKFSGSIDNNHRYSFIPDSCSSRNTRNTTALRTEDWRSKQFSSSCGSIPTDTTNATASSSTTTYESVVAPVGGGAYDISASSTSSLMNGVSSTSDSPSLQQDDEKFNQVQCNICLEDYPKSELKQHRGCSCVLCEECLMKSVEHFQADEDQPKAGSSSYVKCAVCLKTVECKRAFVSLEESAKYSLPPEYITIPILFRNEPGTDANNNSSRNSMGLFSYPWLIRVPSLICAREFVDYLESINPVPEANHRLLSVKADGKSCGQCIFSSRCNGCELPREGMISLSSCNSIMISFTGLNSDRLMDMQVTDMAFQNEFSSSWQYNKIEEPTIDIYDCLRTFSETELLDEQNPWFCPRCKANRRATKTLSICKFPDYLIVVLKRFVFLDHSSNKLNNRLTFPIDDLDISEYVAEGFKKDVGNYDLYSCVCHSGTASAGHYTAFSKNPVSNKWHYFNDGSVTERTPASSEYSSAYVLFYERQGRECNIPQNCNRPLPDLNGFNSTLTASSFTPSSNDRTKSPDTRGTYLHNGPSIPAVGPVRVEGDFINEMNLQVNSSSFGFPQTSTESDLLALEVDDGVDNDGNRLLEIRDGLGIVDNDLATVTSSTSVRDTNPASDFGFDSLAREDDNNGSAAATSSSTVTQHYELSSTSNSCPSGGADSTSNE